MDLSKMTITYLEMPPMDLRRILGAGIKKFTPVKNIYSNIFELNSI